MPVEIRELVIQAQVAQREGDSVDEAEKEEEGEEEEKKASLPAPSKQDDLVNELKIWLIDYLEKQKRRF